GTTTGAGTGAPNTVATRSVRVCTPSSIVSPPGSWWYMAPMEYRSFGPANPTVAVIQWSMPASFSTDQPSFTPGCRADPAPHPPQCWMSPTVRIAFTRYARSDGSALVRM